MKNILIRAGIIFAVFIAACIFFFLSLDEHSFSEADVSFVDSKASLPLISFIVNGNEINLTKGYTVKRDDRINRKHITPVGSERELSVVINEMGQDIKKLDAAVLVMPDMTEYENISSQIFEKDESGRKVVKLKLSKELVPRREYTMRVSLTNSNGNVIYYYTSLMFADFGDLSQSMLFVNDFHRKTFDKNEVYSLDAYMEADEDKQINDYAHIDITATPEALSYGEMSPTEIYRSIPNITEYNKTYVSVYLDFYLSAYTTNGLEKFKCKEEYRFNYTPKKTYLMSYDRYMDTVFEGNYVSVKDNGIKLGISNAPQTQRVYSPNRNQLMFVYNNELYHMNIKDNVLTRLHTFLDEESLIRNSVPEYAYNMFSIDNEGNASFAVYGYIGKGVYEGRNGIIYYKYDSADKLLTEQMFIPLNMDFADMDSDFMRVSYTSETDVYYFTMFDSLYSYELETGALNESVENLGQNWLYFDNSKTIVYSDSENITENKKIIIYNIASKERKDIICGDNSIINILGTVDERIVMGTATKKNVSITDKGEQLIPYDSISIIDIQGNTVKKLDSPEDRFIEGVSFDKGIISYKLCMLKSEASEDTFAVYETVGRDVLVNLTRDEADSRNYTSRLLEKTKTEYYMTMPSNYKTEKAPKLEKCLFRVINKDTQVLLRLREARTFAASAFGKILKSDINLGPVLSAAKGSNGTVMAPDGSVIWKKGITTDEKNLKITQYKADAAGGFRQAVIKMLCSYKGITPEQEYNPGKISFYDYIKKYISANTVCLTQAELGNILYFVSNGNPAIASYKDYYVLIYAYNKTDVEFYDPVAGKAVKQSKQEAEKAFLQAGGVYFITY
ncbi:MAG: hypothetical protein PUB67_04320 [Clostridiales bacterium]|nr:hypothetical protein [Clostridiales bacterium]